MDPIGWFIATMHQMVGHDTAARFIGRVPIPGERAHCILCRFERGDPEVSRQSVIDAIGLPR